MIRPAQDLRSRLWHRTVAEEDEVGRKEGDGRRKEERERRWDKRGDDMDEEGVVSRDDGCDIWEEKDA